MPLEEFSELSDYPIDPAAVRLLPRAFSEQHEVVVLEASDDPNEPVVVAMVRPDDTPTRLRVADFLARAITVKRLNRYEVTRAIATAYGDIDDSFHTVVKRKVGPESTPPELLDDILWNAVNSGASDIHIEAFQGDVDVRLRIDGILHQAFTHVNPRTVDSVVSRLKVMANLDITEKRRPQDGRIRCGIDFPDGRRIVDFRISVVPSPAGEDAVIRVLDADTGLIPVSALGMEPEIEADLIRLLENPEGLILVTGPTGSGKTTSLYAALIEVNDGRRKIITAEDPIEYYIEKINQKQVNEKLPMATLLRALLRQDPDVMLVGEVRDLETGSTAIHAASTGHVVLGTLHTSDAIGAVPRLRGLGLENSEIADALLAVLAQRLVRRLCADCAAPKPIDGEWDELFRARLGAAEAAAPVGCDECHHTGYRGRVGIFELLIVDREMQFLIADGAHTGPMKEHAAAHGFRGMLDDALDKVQRGETSLDELRRVIPYRHLMVASEETG